MKNEIKEKLKEIVKRLDMLSFMKHDIRTHTCDETKMQIIDSALNAANVCEEHKKYIFETNDIEGASLQAVVAIDLQRHKIFVDLCDLYDANSPSDDVFNQSQLEVIQVGLTYFLICLLKQLARNPEILKGNNFDQSIEDLLSKPNDEMDFIVKTTEMAVDEIFNNKSRKISNLYKYAKKQKGNS
ncbi:MULTISPECIES: hypothetical protein [Cysteiniphilum]|uniref:hypothetical protein n=1 Tax=Cysteiniphilum TaxID=2056696 RepID=UPI00177EFC34|nr:MULTISPECIES: hypothetical protein [Cysteiniphilum]